MKDKGKGKAPLESSEGRVNPREKLILGQVKINDDPSSGVISTHSGDKRKQSSVLEEMNYYTIGSRRATMEDDDPPLLDFRSPPVRKPPSPCYLYHLDPSKMKDYEQNLKDWEEIIMLADFLTKAAVEEMNEAKAKERVQHDLCHLEKKLEVAKDPIKQLITFEKENSQKFENVSNDFESMKKKISGLKDYSGQAMQRYRITLMYYSENVGQLQATSDDVQQPKPKPTEEHKESPGNGKEKVIDEEEHTGRFSIQDGCLIDAVQVTQEGYPNFTVQTDIGLLAPATGEDNEK